MDPRGPALVVELGIIAMAAGLLLAPLAQTPWQLYMTLGALVGGGINCLAYTGQSMYLTHWFERRPRPGSQHCHAGPVTVMLPDAGKPFMSMQVINEDQYTPAIYYGAGSHTLTKEGIDTRYVLVVVRMLFDPAKPQDVQQVHAVQDALKAGQQSPGIFRIPNWDEASHEKVRAALLQLGNTISDTRRMFGAEDQVDPARHLIGSALLWGGNPEKDALYLPVTPARNDGTTVHKLTVRDVPVDGFWSVTVYAEGYTVRLFRPRPEILDGTWKFPEAHPVS
jgi:hypothetical protein